MNENQGKQRLVQMSIIVTGKPTLADLNSSFLPFLRLFITNCDALTGKIWVLNSHLPASFPDNRNYREKNEMLEEAQRLIKTIKQMEASLDGLNKNGHCDLDDGDLRVSYPLNRCLSVLKEKFNTISKLHRERFEQVKSESTTLKVINLASNLSQNLYKHSNPIHHILNHPSSQ